MAFRFLPRFCSAGGGGVSCNMGGLCSTSTAFSTSACLATWDQASSYPGEVSATLQQTRLCRMGRWATGATDWRFECWVSEVFTGWAEKRWTCAKAKCQGPRPKSGGRERRHLVTELISMLIFFPEYLFLVPSPTVLVLFSICCYSDCELRFNYCHRYTCNTVLVASTR